MALQTFETVSPREGYVVRLVTDRGQATFKTPMRVDKGELIRFEHDGEWAVAILAPLTEPVDNRLTRYPLPLKRVEAQVTGG